MKYYKTVEDMLSGTFEKKGLRDDKGNPIKQTGKTLTKEEYLEYRKNKLDGTTKRMRIK